MFARIMAVVMAAILITTLGLSAVWWFSMRNQQIDARLDYLISEAQDIAYLAGNVNGTEIGTFWGSTTRSILGRKAEKVNREFGAYIAVVDRAGNVMDNMRTAYSEDPEFVSSISGEDISAALERILSGETIRIRLDEGSAPTFTVGVPFMEDKTVIGAVFIQTKAQRIESGLSEMAGRIALITGGIMLLSGAALFLFIRSAMKPLNTAARLLENRTIHGRTPQR